MVYELTPERLEEENKICFECGGTCCRQMSVTTFDRSYHLRYNWLDTDKIYSEELEGGAYRLVFEFDCIKWVDGKCSAYNEERPVFCAEYPRNFLKAKPPRYLLDKEAESCPLLRKLLEEEDAG